MKFPSQKYQISTAWLEEKNACPNAVKEFSEQSETDAVKIIRKMTDRRYRLDWANWLIARVMTRPQYLAYAIYSAEQVIDIFEKKYPDDKRPRDAIEAAKAVLKDDTAENRERAASAVSATWEAWAEREEWAACVAWAAVEAARTTWGSKAAWAAASAADAAGKAAETADAAEAAGRAMQIKILRQGLALL